MLDRGYCCVKLNVILAFQLPNFLSEYAWKLSDKVCFVQPLRWSARHRMDRGIAYFRLVYFIIIHILDNVHRQTGPPVPNTDFSIDPDYLQLEAVTLQRQQTTLQAQQNRIVKLLAVNQNKTKLPQPRVAIFDGNPVDYRSFIRRLRV